MAAINDYILRYIYLHLKAGGDERDWTAGLRRARAALSLLSYIPKMVGLPGVEPGTSRLSGVRSNQLS